ncbi:MAG: antibiotic biosynthesis monooxygenase [Candidatus Thermoplasmatota archaeon]|nr:antibiotic biosynthesis monooxygenase [Candidatus Thermoplasmatota archaeon]
MDLIIDVKTREEYYIDHIEGALNIPVWDFKFYLDFLKDKSVKVYCGPRGKRSEMAVEFLQDKGIDAEEIPTEDLDDYEHVGEPMVTAINYLSVKPGHEEEFEEKVEDLCMKTMDKEGFIGTKVFRTTNISFGGGMIPGEYEEIEVKPTKYVMLTYWKDRESHEKFHDFEEIKEGFKEIMPHICVTPHEVFADIIH